MKDMLIGKQLLMFRVTWYIHLQGNYLPYNITSHLSKTWSSTQLWGPQILQNMLGANSPSSVPMPLNIHS